MVNECEVCKLPISSAVAQWQWEDSACHDTPECVGAINALMRECLGEAYSEQEDELRVGHAYDQEAGEYPPEGCYYYTAPEAVFRTISDEVWAALEGLQLKVEDDVKAADPGTLRGDGVALYTGSSQYKTTIYNHMQRACMEWITIEASQRGAEQEREMQKWREERKAKQQ